MGLRCPDTEIVEVGASDLASILAIERESHPTPWPASLFRAEMELPWVYLHALRVDGAIAGYIDFWTVREELHILNLAVASKARRGGIGRRLLEHAITQGAAVGSEYVTLEVRESNEGALALYRSRGFFEAGVIQGYYLDTKEDARYLVLPRRLF